MVDKKLSQFDEVSYGDVSYFPVLDSNTKNAKIKATMVGARTNCITEIPQDIKLSLNNGTLTLKSGSKVYIPNGRGTFNVVTISNDLTTSGVAYNGPCFYLVNSSGTYITPRALSQCATFSTRPTAAISGVYEGYCSEDNKMYLWNSNNQSWEASGRSLPVGVISMGSTSPYIKNIDQVFNGFGYIGSTVFALPGVKGLIPNGRNADGTLKNTSFTTSNVLTETRTDYGTNIRAIKLNATYISAFALSNYIYDYENNFNYESSTKRTMVCLGRLTTTSNKIDSFVMPAAFQAVDYADFKAAKDDMMSLSKDQTVDGINVFAKEITIETNSSGRYNAKVPYTQGTAPSSNLYAGTTLLSSSGTLMAQNYSFVDTGNNVYSRLWVKSPASGSSSTASMGIVYKNNGTYYTECPTPSSVTDNSTKIATTQWFNNKVKVVSELPASPVSGVFYYITD